MQTLLNFQNVSDEGCGYNRKFKDLIISLRRNNYHGVRVHYVTVFVT